MKQKGAIRDEVYLGYTRDELDWQYDHTKRFPDTSIFTRARAAKTANVREKIKSWLDVQYGSGDDEKLDIYPAARDKAPIAVFVHGGAWQRGSKDDYGFPAASFVPRGVTWITTEFSRVPRGSLDVQVKQNRDAIAWIYRNASSFAGDPQRIYVLGHSSGAHLSAMVHCTEWTSLYGLPADLVKGGVCMSGIYDLEPVMLTYRNKYLGLDEAATRLNSPIHNVRETFMPSLVIGCGEHDTAEFHRQWRAYAQALRRRGHSTIEVELAGRHHFAVSDAFNEDGPLLDAILALIGV